MQQTRLKNLEFKNRIYTRPGISDRWEVSARLMYHKQLQQTQHRTRVQMQKHVYSPIRYQPTYNQKN